MHRHFAQIADNFMSDEMVIAPDSPRVFDCWGTHFYDLVDVVGPAFHDLRLRRDFPAVLDAVLKITTKRFLKSDFIFLRDVFQTDNSSGTCSSWKNNYIMQLKSDLFERNTF